VLGICSFKHGYEIMFYARRQKEMRKLYMLTCMFPEHLGRDT
jgi:hypothetical protein